MRSYRTLFTDKNSLRFARVVSFCLAGIALALITFKAAHTSFTHDESSTYLNFVTQNQIHIWKCFTDPACWSTANNHLLNTQMMRYTLALFGSSELSLRLPNLLAGLLYLLCGLHLVQTESRTVGIMLFGTALLTSNPFVLDFFGLARGYGMAAGLVMLHLYGFWRYLESGNFSWLIAGAIGGLLSVFANLTAIACFAGITGGALVYALLLLRNQPAQTRTQLHRLLLISMLSTAVLGVYFYKPLRWLTELGEFDYGEQTLWGTFTNFSETSLYGAHWLGPRSSMILAICVTVLIAGALLLPWTLPGIRKTPQGAHFASLVLLIIIAFLVAAHVFTGAEYPTGRKTVIFYPPLVFTLFFGAQALSRSVRHTRFIFAGLAVLFVWHFFRAFQPDFYREWWYDARTKEMLLGLPRQESHTVLETEWLYHPTSEFYLTTHHLPITVLPYSRDIHPESTAQYYYLSHEVAGQCSGRFTLEKDFGAAVLLRRRETDKDSH